MSPERRRWLGYAAAFAVLQLAYASVAPAGQGPDEAEHRVYVEALQRQHRLPVLPALPQVVRDAAGLPTAWVSVPTGLTGPLARQAQHPPLAYLAYALWGSVVEALGLPPGALRWLGLLWGWLALWALVRLTADLRLATAGLAAALPAAVLLPGPIYLCAVVSNDGPAFAVGMILAWRLWRSLEHPPTRRDTLYLALALTAGLLIKVTLAIYLLLALPLWWRQTRRPGEVALLLVLPLLALLPWLWRNQQLYGLWLPRVDARPFILHWGTVVADDTAPLLFISGLGVALLYWLPTSLAPLWLLMPWYTPLMIGYLLCWLVAVAGWVGLRGWRRTDPPALQRALVRQALLTLLLTVGLYLLQFLHQDGNIPLYAGRYIVPFLPALLLPLAWGCSSGWPDRASRGVSRALPWIWLVAAAALLPVIAHPPSWDPTAGGILDTEVKK
ncbi:MAG: hypothetical protein IT204_17950 [Fimbriimonadaceae bacterium]|nr:hypothetical protein [Fimbriimonadaceae bacterium]